LLWPNKKYGIHLINTKISLALLFFTQSTVSYLFKVIYLLFKVSYLQKLVIYIKLFIQDRIPLLNKKLQKPESTAGLSQGLPRTDQFAKKKTVAAFALSHYC